MRSILFVPLLLMAVACEQPDRPASADVLAHAADAAARSAPGATAPQRAAAESPRAPIVPPPEAMTDAAISERIGGELAADPAMAGADVSINTDKGVVVLSGTVRSHEQTGIASAHAQRQDGVLRVDNHLRPALS